jgi:hypothetical protein
MRGSLRETRTADSAALIDELASGELLDPESSRLIVAVA